MYRTRPDCTETDNFYKLMYRNRMYRTRLVRNRMYIQLKVAGISVAQNSKTVNELHEIVLCE